MRSWVFRHRRRLEVVYGAPGRARPLAEPLGDWTERHGSAPGVGSGVARRLRAYEMIPLPRRPLRRAG